MFGVKRDQNRLIVHHAIAVGKEFCLGFIRGMFIVFFQISTVIIYEYPDISACKFFAALYPYDLSAMITWLHTITANVYPELSPLPEHCWQAPVSAGTFHLQEKLLDLPILAILILASLCSRFSQALLCLAGSAEMQSSPFRTQRPFFLPDGI